MQFSIFCAGDKYYNCSRGEKSIAEISCDTGIAEMSGPVSDPEGQENFTVPHRLEADWSFKDADPGGNKMPYPFIQKHDRQYIKVKVSQRKQGHNPYPGTPGS